MKAKPAVKGVEGVFPHILGEIRPSRKELETAVANINDITSRLKGASPKNVEIIVAGSVARGTQLSGSSDLDIFMLFPNNMPERKMEVKALEIAKSVVDKKKGESFSIKYAEHPYLRLLMRGNARADIVPAFKISSSDERATAVDRTQLHNEFIISKLTKAQKDQVRLLKFFLKLRGIYGAEAKTEGFSGYLCELLIYSFGNFVGVLDAFSRMNLPLAVDPISKARHTSRDEASKFVRKFGSEFIVVDPVDPNRNVAANVSRESLGRLVIESRKFLSSPTIKEFYGVAVADLYSSKRLRSFAKSVGLDVYVIDFTTKDIAEDIIWQQLRKLRLRLEDELKRGQFEPVISLNAVRPVHGTICFFLKEARLASKVLKGPSVFMRSSSDAFIKAHKGARMIGLEKERLFAIEKPEHETPERLIGAFLSRAPDFPSYLDRKRAKLYSGSVPEECAKSIYLELAKNAVLFN